ncbi:MAG: hypothetical protein ACRELE_10275 [Gemmatimonadales bacterium]
MSIDSSVFQVVRRTLALISAVGANACAIGTQGAQNDQIVAPQAFVSPNMDFARINKVAIFPLFAAGQVSDDPYAEKLVAAITSEIQGRQAQWKILPYQDALALIQRYGLGAGYKNLQADFNTYAGPTGAFVISAPTRKFLADMEKAAGVDAFIFGTYALQKLAVTHNSILGGPYVSMEEVTRVGLGLYYAKESQTWWNATVARYGNRADVIDAIARSLANAIGKGTLRQM